MQRLFDQARIRNIAARAARRLPIHRLLFQGTAIGLYGAVRLARRAGPPRGRHTPRHVVHVTPAYFSDLSYIGGGERYVTALAEAMAERVETRLISFGPTRASFRKGHLKVEVYPVRRWLAGGFMAPISYRFLRELMSADVVHGHQYRSTVANLAILAGAALGKRVFVSEYGGVGYNLTQRLPIADFVDCFLSISAFSAKMLPVFKHTRVVYGGVDKRFLQPHDQIQERKRTIVFVGRLLPHKGINYLIEAIDQDMHLEVIGRAYDPEYLALLQQLAQGKQVRFITDASDEAVIQAYRNAVVTVLPSVYTDVYGTHYDVPELLGLVMLESMACGTPVICTNVGAMPEYVEDGVTGFVAPPNDPVALRERLAYILANPAVARQLGQTARQRVQQEFTWEAVALRCLAAYHDV